MFEVELKFQIAAGGLSALRAALVRGRTQGQRLQALYYDTADRALARAGMALRLRKEGRRWVQTLKAGSDDHFRRLESNVSAGAAAAGQTPALDVRRHAGTQAGDALLALLHEAGDPPLQLRYRTDIRRTRRDLRVPGATIELAFDEGEIVAGDRRLPVHEIEFELKGAPMRPQAVAAPRGGEKTLGRPGGLLARGSVSSLFAVAGRWVARHALRLDVRSKAERGDRLAEGLERGAAVKAVAPRLTPQMPAADALRAMLRAALSQVLANAAEVADGGCEAEHVHQLRVGLRRLRSALRLFGDLSPGVDAAWQERLTEPFRRLGVARDIDALNASLLPRLREAGAPGLSLSAPADADDPGALVREAGFNALMLELLAFTAAAPDSDADAPRLSDIAAQRLQRLHRQTVADAKRFGKLEVALQHRVRKRLKRLRYGIEFVSSLLPAKALQRYSEPLRDAQDALGEYNDLVVAQGLFEARVLDAPQAWFALGWIAAQRPRAARRCERALKALKQAPRPF
jgi:triphosphatase